MFQVKSFIISDSYLRYEFNQLDYCFQISDEKFFSIDYCSIASTNYPTE